MPHLGEDLYARLWHHRTTLFATGRFGKVIFLSPDEQGWDVELSQLVANVVARVKTTQPDQLLQQTEPAFLGCGPQKLLTRPRTHLLNAL